MDGAGEGDAMGVGVVGSVFEMERWKTVAWFRSSLMIVKTAKSRTLEITRKDVEVSRYGGRSVVPDVF